jgi:hypothetical protein
MSVSAGKDGGDEGAFGGFGLFCFLILFEGDDMSGSGEALFALLFLLGELGLSVLVCVGGVIIGGEVVLASSIHAYFFCDRFLRKVFVCGLLSVMIIIICKERKERGEKYSLGFKIFLFLLLG